MTYGYIHRRRNAEAGRRKAEGGQGGMLVGDA